MDKLNRNIDLKMAYTFYSNGGHWKRRLLFHFTAKSLINKCELRDEIGRLLNNGTTSFSHIGNLLLRQESHHLRKLE